MRGDAILKRVGQTRIQDSAWQRLCIAPETVSLDSLERAPRARQSLSMQTSRTFRGHVPKRHF